MKILAFEFSASQRSVALVASVQGVATRIEYEAIETGPQANRPLAMIDEVLKNAQIDRGQVDCLAVGLGPGSYTGIRIAIAVAQGWSLGHSVKLQGLSSSECLAAQAHAEGLSGRIAVVIDAQRGEFYLNHYELNATGWRELHPLRLASPAEVHQAESEGFLLVGPEVTHWFPHGRCIFPSAAMLGKLAAGRTGFVDGASLEPIYLRQTTFVKAPTPRILH